MEENNIKKEWIKCSVTSFLIAFCFSMVILEFQQIRNIFGNSYYLSSVPIFLQHIFWPVHYCIIYSIWAEIICQIMFCIMPKEKKVTQKTLTIPIVSNIINFIIVIFVFYIKLSSSIS